MFLGRVVRPGRDPQWLDTDRALALAWRRNKAATCECGTRADEWDVDDDAYISDHYTCEGCARLAQEKTSNLDRMPDGTPAPGQQVFLKPRELHEAELAARTSRPPAPGDND